MKLRSILVILLVEALEDRALADAGGHALLGRALRSVGTARQGDSSGIVTAPAPDGLGVGFEPPGEGAVGGQDPRFAVEHDETVAGIGREGS